MLTQRAPSPPPPATGRVERYDTIVIGAGQAGLAAGYFLAMRDADFLIIDAGSRVGNSWRQRWDSLRLFTPAAYSGLPGMAFPAAPMHLPDKDEVADYLERYAERFELPIRLDTRVESLSWNGERYVIEAGVVTYEADQVVVATGPFQTPRIPSIATQLSPTIHQIHSSQYRNPFELPPGPVLVVGAGNSGAQIALELARFREVTLAGRSTGSIPRNILGRDIYRWIWPILTRLTADTSLGRKLRKRTSHGDPLVGFGPSLLADAGVTRVGRVDEIRDGVALSDGKKIEASVVVWATGFSQDFRWINLPLPMDGGAPRHARGVVAEAPGLYFVGRRFQHRLTSALLGGVSADAEYVVDRLLAGETARSR
jgi:putative flavoprotein involved in K+ transport